MSLLSGLFRSVPSVSGHVAVRLVDAGAVMVDVRSTAEWNAGHGPFAQHMALPQLARRQSRIPDGKQVVVVCRSGRRSKGATRQLIAAGHDAVNVSGGMAAWQQAGGRLVDRSGKPGRVV
jgi:rhodanese-related sulfurtransferase